MARSKTRHLIVLRSGIMNYYFPTFHKIALLSWAMLHITAVEANIQSKVGQRRRWWNGLTKKHNV